MSLHETTMGLEMNCKCISDNEFKLKELKHNYDKTKSSIELKHNSTTNFKKTLLKNNKIENKIEVVDNKIENKITWYEEQLIECENRRLDRIQAIRDKYEAKMEKEINEINNTAKSHRNSLQNGLDYQRKSKNIVIKDLSANIIEPSLGDIIDEEAYPVLIKLKCDIKKIEDELKEYNIERKYLVIANTNAYEKKEQSRLREIQLKELEEKRVEEEQRKRAIEQFRIQREQQNRQDEERWAKQKEENKEKERLENIKNEWNNKYFEPLSSDDKKKFKYVDYSPHKEKLRTMNNLDTIKKYINDTYKIVEKRKAFNKSISDEKFILSDEKYSFYFGLDYHIQDKIALLKTESKQRKEIDRLFEESKKDTTDSEDDNV